MIKRSQILLALGLFAQAQSSFAWDCQSDCGRYIRGPWWRRDDATRAACIVEKAASCKLQQGAVNFFLPRVRPYLAGTFNSTRWAFARTNDRETEYLTQCLAAGVAACGAVAVTLGPGNPWAAAVGGAVGVFVSSQICQQSKAW